MKGGISMDATVQARYDQLKAKKDQGTPLTEQEKKEWEQVRNVGGTTEDPTTQK